MKTKVVKESKIKLMERVNETLEILAKEYPDVKIQLDFNSPAELLIATILSAQCTDERVNKVTKILFAKYKVLEDYLKVPDEELEKDIFSTGYYKAKTQKIKATSKMLIEDFGGEVPNNIEDLTKLPGVGRKTANVVLGHIFGIPSIVVDTHVVRISNKLKWVNSENPEKIEMALMELIPKEQWVIFTHYIINHGRKVCIARRPQCAVCSIKHLCPSSEV